MLDIQRLVDVTFQEPRPEWAQGGIMALSPYFDGHGLCALGRAYVEGDSPVPKSCIFLARAKDPFTFRIRPVPIFSPRQDGDASDLAFEDPTFVAGGAYGQGFMYSHVRSAPGHGKNEPDVYVALRYVFQSSTRGLRACTLVEPTVQDWWKQRVHMCKEGELVLRPNQRSDALFYEFSDGAASRIASADVDLWGRMHGEGVPRVAWDSKLWLDTRPDMWDSDHVSTGPIVTIGDKRLMFYNGRNADTWGIGQIVFDPKTLKIEYRSDKPIITPPPGEIGPGGQRIAFASGAWVQDAEVHLYYHVADKRVCCAVGSLK